MVRNKWTKPINRKQKYILRNIHPKRMDVMIGDLGYHIPYGQSRDLLSLTAHLDPAAIERSRSSGSIAERLRQGVLIEVQSIVLAPPPTLSVAEPTAISFPQRTKSLLVPKNGDLTENLQSIVAGADEDAELLKQMEEEEKAISEGELAGLPVTIDPTKAKAVLDKVSGGCTSCKSKK